MACQVETKGLLFFLQEEAVPEGQGLGSWVGEGEKRGPQPWVAPIFPREVATEDKDLPSQAPRKGEKATALPQGREVLASRWCASTSACLEDKGARRAGSTWAWLWQGRGWQEQAPSGHKTQAQLSCPPTCTSWAQTSL